MDAILLILALLSISVPFIIAKLWWWVGFWITLSIVLAVVEPTTRLIKSSGKAAGCGLFFS